LYKERIPIGIKVKRPPIFNPSWFIGYFDEASQDLCGVGAVLKLTNGIVYRLSLWCGISTNTKGELLVLWSLLYYANLKHIS
jgi:hypothetical protein